MRALFAFLVAAPITLTMAAQNPVTTLASLRDTTRPLLIFGAPDSAAPGQQIAELASHGEDLRTRDMRVVLLTAAPSSDSERSTLPKATFDAAEQAHLRRRFHVGPNEFAVILVGKDGGEKLRSSKPIPWQKLASTVDAMPMRRDEMKTR